MKRLESATRFLAAIVVCAISGCSAEAVESPSSVAAATSIGTDIPTFELSIDGDDDNGSDGKENITWLERELCCVESGGEWIKEAKICDTGKNAAVKLAYGHCENRESAD